MACGEAACPKTYLFVGSASDGSTNPIDGVTISIGGIARTTTNSIGVYTWSTTETDGAFSGESVLFEKSGYQNFSSTAFSDSEMGDDCEMVTLTRNAVLTP